MATQEVHALAVGARVPDQNCGFSPCLLGQIAWCGGWERGYHAKTNMGGTKHGGDSGYWHVPHLKYLWTSRVLAQPGILWPFQNMC